MSILTVIGVVCIVIGLVLIYSVLVKKFPQLKLIDLSTLAKERHAQVKSRIMKDRFDRGVGKLQTKTSNAVGGLVSKMRGAYEKAYGSLKRMEAGLEADARKPRTPEETASRIVIVLAEGQRFVDDDRLEEAEQAFIEALRLDPKHPDAYRGLADVYLEQKAYDQAAETLEFLLRLNAADERALSRLGEVETRRGNFHAAETQYLRSIDASHGAAGHRAELGRLYQAAGEPKKAFEQFRMAVQAEPYNPKFLDYFLEASILVGDADAARAALGALEEVNPENAKLGDFRSRIDALAEKA